jgi:peptide/nickel transport system substrate-binding protein
MYLHKLVKSTFVVSVCTATTLFMACSSGGSDKKDVKGGKPEVTVWELSDADMLNPIIYSDASAGYILTNMYSQLMNIDFKTLELVPVLAMSKPLIEKTEDGKGLLITYEIRPEATWDNGTPITAKDVEFTLKVIKNPKVKNENNKPYYEFIRDIKFYPENPKKFTLISDRVYILAEASSGDYPIMPAYIYDTKGLMTGFTIKQLNEEKDKLSNDPKINEFATDFNSEKRQREKEFIGGSGAYKLEEWATGQRIVLVRKDKWWGDKVKEKNCFFEANPPKIIYQTINDQTTALVALKAGNLDVMYSIKSKDFKDLPNSAKFTENFNAYTPMQLAYTYIGINTRLPKFQDKLTRQAFAHLVDVDKMIKTIKYGQAQRVVGYVHPSKKDAYNSAITPYDFNPEKAKTLLAQAGWKDSNGDGTLDKMINNERVDLSFDFAVNSGNDERKSVALLFQEEAAKIGIKVNVVAQEWSVYLDNCKAHKTEMFFGAWIGTPIPNDPKQIYHTESYNGGSNYTGFGNKESDALIDSIRIQIDGVKRALLEKQLQEVLHNEVSYIYLWAPTERIAIHKRFENAETSVTRPGFWEAGFKVAK